MTTVVVPDAPACPDWCDGHTYDEGGAGWTGPASEREKRCRRSETLRVDNSQMSEVVEVETMRYAWLGADGVHVDPVLVRLEVVGCLTAVEAHDFAEIVREAAARVAVRRPLAGVPNGT